MVAKLDADGFRDVAEGSVIHTVVFHHLDISIIVVCTCIYMVDVLQV